MNMTEKLAAFAVATDNEIFDAEEAEYYEDGKTYETLEQWENSSKGWNERSAMKSGEIAGFPFRAWKQMQAVKGQPRRPMSVIDFGDVRFYMEVDLTVFL